MTWGYGRFGMGSSTDVLLEKRISTWLQLVPKLIAHLQIKNFALMSHSAGIVEIFSARDHIWRCWVRIWFSLDGCGLIRTSTMGASFSLWRNEHAGRELVTNAYIQYLEPNPAARRHARYAGTDIKRGSVQQDEQRYHFWRI